MLHPTKSQPIILSKEAWKGVSSNFSLKKKKFNTITMGENMVKRTRGAKVKVISKDYT
jgi:hypothetical protein